MKLSPVLAALALHLAPIVAFAQKAAVDLPVAITGVNGEALSDSPETDAIDMFAPTQTQGPMVITNQLQLTLTITPGTTANVTVKCYESATGAANSWAQITSCSGTCPPDTRTYAMADFETQGSVKTPSSRWQIVKRWAKCKVDDAADGTGTVVITGTRSWQ